MAETIAKDTTWNGRVVLDDDVSIAEGVTLTIARGTEIVGGGFDIVGPGSIKAIGSGARSILFQDVYINPTADDFEGGDLTFRNVEFAGATTIATSARVGLDVDRCVFNGTTYPINLWDPQDGSITRSVFIDSFGVSVNASDDFVFSENFVVAQRIFEGSSYALESWGSGRVESTGNAFLAGDRIALRAGGGASVIDSLGDYFAAADPDDVVDDRGDDPERGRVLVRYPDPLPNDALERPLAVWNSLTLPDQVFRDAKLLGSRAATLIGNDASNRLGGNDAGNRIDGGIGADTINGRLGDDDLRGDADADRIRGGSGNDSLDGGGGDDGLEGGGNNDRIFGGDGADTLTGDGGSDTLSGGADNDKLSGGGGDDVLTTGDGADRVLVLERGFGFDRVLDFSDTDRLVVDKALFDADDVAIGTRDRDVVLTFAGGGTILLTGAVPVFDAGDVVFV